MNALHFILTRFNIKIFKADKTGKSVQTKEWLDKRFELFEKYCLPSVMNQSDKNFCWVILFDKDTPIEYKERISNYSQLIRPLYLSEEEASDYVGYYRKAVTRLVQESVGNEVVKILTTYLDNDDMLHKDYINYVQQKSQSITAETVFSFDYGLQYFTELNFATLIKYSNNHFLTLCEFFNGEGLAKTVQYYRHYYIETYKDLIVEHDRVNKGMWVEVVHADNIDNDVKMTLDYKKYNLSDSYNIFGVNLHDSSILKYIISFYPRFLKQIIRRTMYRFK